MVGRIRPVAATALKCLKSLTMLVGVVDWPDHEQVLGGGAIITNENAHQGFT
jgi:hypothetical protein